MASNKEIGKLLLTLQADVSQLKKQLSKTGKQSGKVAGKTTGIAYNKALNKQIDKTAVTIGKKLKKSLNVGDFINPRTLGLVGLVAGLGKAVDTGRKFEKVMSEVKAVSRASGEEFKKLQAEAQRLGKTTEFTAAQAGEGMIFLSRAGLSAEESLKAIGPALDFATANNIALGKSADIATNILSQFGKEVEELPKVMDILSETTATSNTNVEQLAEAMKYAGPTAKALNIPLSETASAVGILGNNGLQGSLATRALGTSMTRLAKPTSQMRAEMDKLGVSFFDANGKFIGINGTVGELQRGLAGMTDEQKQASLATLFGAEAIQEWNILLATGEENLNKYTAELEGATGATEDMASIMRDNLDGSIREAQSALENLGIVISERLTGGLRGLLEYGITPFLQGLADWIDLTPELNNGVILLQDEIAEFEKKITDTALSITLLNDAFRKGRITNELYLKELERLTSQQIIYKGKVEDLNGQIEIQEDITKKLADADGYLTNQQEELVKKNIELQKQIQSGNITQQEATTIISKNAEGLIYLAKKEKEFKEGKEELIEQIENEKNVLNGLIKINKTGTIEYENQDQKVNQLKDSLLELENNYYNNIRATELLSNNYTELQDSIDAISTSKSIKAFEEKKQAALALARANLTVLESEFAVNNALGTGKLLDPNFIGNQKKAIVQAQLLKGSIEKLQQTSFTGREELSSSGSSGTNKKPSTSSRNSAQQREEAAALKKRRAELKKAFEEEQRLRIKALDEEKLSVKERYEEILSIKKRASDKLNSIGFDNDFTTQQEEILSDYKKELGDALDDSEQELEKYRGNVEKVSDSFNELKKNAVEEIKSIESELEQIDFEVAGVRSDRNMDLADRFLEAQDELKNLSKSSRTYAKDQESLLKEIAILEKNVTEEQVKQAEERAKKTEAEKIIEAVTMRETKLLEKRTQLLERQAVAQAFQANQLAQIDNEGNVTQEAVQNIRIEGQGEALKVFYKTQEGLEKEITDTKNREYALDLVNKQAQLDAEQKGVIESITREVTAYKDLYSQKEKLLKEHTKVFNEALDKQIKKAKELEMQLKMVAQQRATVGQSTPGFRLEQRYKGGDVKKGGAYLVGENPDGTLNRTTEIFVPKMDGMIIPASKSIPMLEKYYGIDLPKDGPGVNNLESILGGIGALRSVTHNQVNTNQVINKTVERRVEVNFGGFENHVHQDNSTAQTIMDELEDIFQDIVVF